MEAGEITLPEFARAFPLRAPRLSLLIGAGASVTSGVPSASDLIWDFKRQIYASEMSIHPSQIGSVADPAIRESLQRFFDTKAGYPPHGAGEEYSHYFGKAYPDSQDRRLYIAKRLEGSRPGYGYLSLGVLLKAGKIRVAWTTNFDELIEKAYSVVSEGEQVSVVGLDTRGRMEVYLRDERYPILTKLHGDFRFDALKNTQAEVAECDEELRRHLAELSRTYGLAVVGYSGRDASVMDALNTALTAHESRAFPEGLYWCLRDTDSRPPRAENLLSAALAIGVRASFVRIPDFDDFTASLYRACDLQHATVDARLAERRKTRAGYDLSQSSRAEPVLKLNAIPVQAYPDSCYRFKASIQNWAQLREVTRPSNVVAALHRRHVYALGIRSEIQALFDPYGIEDLQVSPIGLEDLRAPDSKTLGMFYEAIARCLVARPPLVAGAWGRRGRILYITRDHNLPADLIREFSSLQLRDAADLIRKARDADYWIHEAVELHLEFREDQLWLLFRPTVHLTADGGSTRWESQNKMDVIRELLAVRYNRDASGLLNFWLRLLRHCAADGLLRFPPSQEAGFEFRLGDTLGVSYHRT